MLNKGGCSRAMRAGDVACAAWVRGTNVRWLREGGQWTA